MSRARSSSVAAEAERIGCGHRGEGAAARPMPVERARAAVGDLHRRCDRIAAP
ncbi:hypothetical protein ACWEQP_04000 [Streptomyces sp. NPDC004044]